MKIYLDDMVMTIEEVSDFLRISDSTIYALTREKKIPARKIGREWRYLKSDLLTWIKEGTMEEIGMVKKDRWGGEYQVKDDGSTLFAMWLPMTEEEKSAILNKATQEEVAVADMIVQYLKDWVKN